MGERQVGIHSVDVPVQKVVHHLLIALCVLYNNKIRFFSKLRHNSLIGLTCHRHEYIHKQRALLKKVKLFQHVLSVKIVLMGRQLSSCHFFIIPYILCVLLLMLLYSPYFDRL